MALTEVPIELSSTPGIVDNSTATAITIDASQNVTLSANLTVTGDLITFGDANTDSINFVADIASNLTPDATNTYDLGTTLKKWRDAYISGTADIATLTSASSTIGTLTISGTATIPYDNLTSGLTAVNVQSALDELAVLTGGGNVGSQANFNIYEFTATNLQTTFDLNATYTKTYIPGYIQVYLNGLMLSETDYVASNGNTVVLNSGADADDILAIVVLDSFNTATQLRVLSIDASASDDAIAVDATDNVTLLGELRGPATFVIDPAAIGDNTGTVQIKGNLQVDGTQTTINSATLDVTDLNITVASGAIDAASANGAGITVDGAAANITYTSATDSWDFNKDVDVTGTVTADGLAITAATPSIQMTDSDNSADAFIQATDGNIRFFADDNNEAANSIITFNIDGGEKIRVTDAGNVGIGEINPSTYGKLVVAGTTPFAVVRSTDTTTAGFSMLVNSGSNGVGSIATDDGGHMTFDTGSIGAGQAERMRIDATGQVGIGGTPSTLLHIIETDNGAPDAVVRIESDDTANSKSLLQYVGRNNTNVATYATIHTDAVAAGENAPIVFSQGASEANERMRIDESGNVSINTNTLFVDAANNRVGIGKVPTQMLDVNASAQIGDTLYVTSNGGANLTQGHIMISSSTLDSPEARGQGVFMFNEGHDRTWYSGTGYNAGGDFHIGFADDTAATNEGARVTNAVFNLYNDANGAVFNENGADRDFRVESDNNTHALFVDAGNSRIGINKSDPFASLEVGGLAAAQFFTGNGGQPDAYSLGRFTTWSYPNSASSGTVWRKVGTMTFPDADYSSMSLLVETIYPNTNFGQSGAAAVRWVNTVSVTRKSNILVDNGQIRGPENGKIQLHRNSIGEWELQAATQVDNQALLLKITLLSSGGGSYITMQEGIVTGSTGGTTISCDGTLNIPEYSSNLITYGAGTFNEGGGDNDFRVESTANPSMLVVDAGTNSVNIAGPTPVSGIVLHTFGIERNYATNAEYSDAPTLGQSILLSLTDPGATTTSIWGSTAWNWVTAEVTVYIATSAAAYKRTYSGIIYRNTIEVANVVNESSAFELTTGTPAAGKFGIGFRENISGVGPTWLGNNVSTDFVIYNNTGQSLTTVVVTIKVIGNS